MEIKNLAMRQTWIEEEVQRCAEDLSIKEDDAFLVFVTSLLLNCRPEDVDPSDIVDGGSDKQIDLIHIEDDTEKGFAEVILVQAKHKKSFESNIAIQIRNGLDWIFERPKSEILDLPNSSFRDKILEIRELRADYGPSNLTISVVHATKGDSSSLSEEYIAEAKILTDKYQSAGFAQFDFTQTGAHEIAELIDAGDRSKRQIDVEIPIIYDVNAPSLIKFGQGDTASIVCTVTGSALAKAASTDPRDAIFDMNVRPFYGTVGKVNRDIWDTCTGTDAARFWFMNNGVTLVCDKFDVVQDPDDAKIKIENAQIVNGCQTTVTIREAFEKGVLSNDTKILLRIYSTDNPNLVGKITLTTNNQNRITDRDLRANDSIQRDIERLMLDNYGHYYERKNKQHRALKGSKRKLIVPSPKAAQACLAVVRLKPSNARGYLAAVWSEHYMEIFQNASVADLLVAYKILEICREQAVIARAGSKYSATKSECVIYGVHHIARAMGYLLTKDKWGNSNTVKIEALLDKITSGKLPANIYSEALDVVLKVREKDKDQHPIPALYFKNSTSQKNLAAKLYSS